MQLLEINRADLSSDLEAGVQALLRDAFSDGEEGETDYYAPYGPPARLLIHRDDRRVVGHLAIYRRHVRIDGETLEIGMLGGVVVAPEHRRKGHCRALVEKAHTFLKAHRIPFSILFAYEPRVYESSGYVLMTNETYFLDTDGIWKTFVFRSSMYAELSDRPWPNRLVDLCGRVV